MPGSAESVAPDWHSIATRLAARLRVHASSASTGYRQDPRSINDPDAPVEPGMSGRWCLLDQYALADYEAAHNDGPAHDTDLCRQDPCECPCSACDPEHSDGCRDGAE